MKEGPDIDSKLEILKSEIDRCKRESVPLFKNNNKHRRQKPPYLTRSSLKAVRKKHFAWKRFMDSKSHKKYTTYIAERNKSSKAIRKAKRDYEKKIAKECKVNPKVFYKYCNFKSKKKNNFIRLKNDKDELATSDKENAEILNTFFSSVFAEESDSPELILSAASKWLYGEDCGDPLDYNYKHPDQTLNDVNVSEDEVLKLLLGVDPNKSSDSNCVHPRLLREGAKELCRPIYLLFKESLSKGVVPTQWKIVTVTPIHKADDRHCAANYRPITITSVLCRLLEKVIKEQFYHNLHQANLLPDEQHGFRTGRSCLTNLLETY